MPAPPQLLYTAAQCRELDRLAIEHGGGDGYALMERAGQAALHCLRRHWPRAHSIAVVCGVGNNGGDGYVLARLARAAGLAPRLMAIEPPRSGDAQRAAREAQQSGLAIEAFDGVRLRDADLVVDAMFGTGLERPLTGAWLAAVQAINACARPLLALDLPSGLYSDSGQVPADAVRAQVTLTFIGAKPGLFTGAGPDHTGRVEFDGLGVPQRVYDRVPAIAWRIDRDSAAALRPRRRPAAHKGDSGHVLVLGGDHGMAGAARLAGEAAARSGAGLVSLGTRADHAAAVAAACPVLMAHGLEDTAGLNQLLARASALVLGPGLGRADWGQRLCAATRDAAVPTVLDADALWHLAAQPGYRDDRVLTPHPGEAARLLGSDSAAVQADRFAAAQAVVGRYGGVCVLKGAGTLVASAGTTTALCDRGSAALASGGTGDVLAGMIGAFLARGLAPRQAAELGVWLHAVAGERMVAGDTAGELGVHAAQVLATL